MIKTIKLYSRIISIVFVFTLVALPSAVMAQTPITYTSADFGNVVIGTTATIVVEIKNTQADDFYFNFSWASNSCGLTASGTPGLVLSRDQSTEIVIDWTPSEPGKCTAELSITNRRVAAAVITVTGNAFLEQADIEAPEGTSLVDAFDDWVANGDIVGKGRGKAGAHYLKAYRNTLVKAVHLMERGQARKAQIKLIMAQKHATFLLKGYALPDLRQKLNDAIASLKHQGVRHLETAEGERPEPGIILDAFDEWVQCGDIKGLGLGKVAGKQVQEFRKKLEKAADLMEQGRTKQAHSQLMEAQKLTRMFIRGIALDDLRAMLSDMLESLRA